MKLYLCPPGPPTIPIFGNSLSIPLYDIHLTLEEWVAKYGPLVGVMMGPQPGLFVTGADSVVAALKKEEFQGRPDTKYVRERSFGERLGESNLLNYVHNNWHYYSGASFYGEASVNCWFCLLVFWKLFLTMYIV